MTDKINQRSFRLDSFLHPQKRWKVAVSIGSIILVIGIAGTVYFGSLNVTQEVRENVNPQTGLPNAVNGIPPAQAQIVFEILIFIGLLILANGISTRYTRLNRKEQ
jgi:TRAP-type C4-dicarboxylate transport system permease small subunit